MSPDDVLGTLLLGLSSRERELLAMLERNDDVRRAGGRVDPTWELTLAQQVANVKDARDYLLSNGR